MVTYCRSVPSSSISSHHSLFPVRNVKWLMILSWIVGNVGYSFMELVSFKGGKNSSVCQLLFHQFWPLFYYSFCGDSLYSEDSGKAFFSTTESSQLQTIQGRAEAPFVSDTSAAPSLLLIKQVVPLDRRAVCSWPFPGNYPLCPWQHSANAMMVRLQVFAAGWRKVAKSPERQREEERETEKVRNWSRQQGRQSEARSKRPCETESFLGSAPWSAAHSRKINWSGFLFLFFQPVNYLQIIEKQLFSHFPRTRPVWLRIEWQPRQTSSSHSNCSDNAFSVTHSHMRLMKQIRHQDYNDKVIFIKSFFVVRFFFFVSHSCSNTCIYKEMAFL